MFNHLDRRTEREVRLQKSKIYKQMLDNQMILNQQYRRKQEELRNWQLMLQDASIRKSLVRNGRRHQSYDDYPNEGKRVYRKQQRIIQFPILKDKETLYEGHSKYVKIKNSPNRRKVISRIRTQQVAENIDQDRESSNQDIEQILSELKSLNKEIAKSKKQVKHKRLFNLGGLTRRSIKDQHHQMDNNTQIDNDEEQFLRHPKKTINQSHSPHDIKSQKDAQHKQQRVQTRKRIINQLLYQSPKNYKRQGISNSLDQKNKLNYSAENDKIIQNNNVQKARERFVQILKKVKNRGQSLFIKLSKFPKDNP